MIRKQEMEFQAPPGYRVLSSEEKENGMIDLQALLRSSKEEFSRLPLRIETEGQRRRKGNIEMKIRDIEESISKFSKPLVIVPDP